MNKEKTQNNIEEKILSRISEEKIAPKARWTFLLEHSYFWLLGTITVVLGGLSISASIFVFENVRWELYQATHENLLTFAIDILPYLWTVLFAVFLIVTYFLISKTKHGYKYHLFPVAVLVVLISIVLGVIFSLVGLGQFVDRDFGRMIPFHEDIERRNNVLWNIPMSGLLRGIILEEDDTFILQNFRGEKVPLVFGMEDYQPDLSNNADLFRVIGFMREGSFYVCGIIEEKMQKVFERKLFVERSKECEDVRPYRELSPNL